MRDRMCGRPRLPRPRDALPLADHVCVGCTSDDHCAAGTICEPSTAACVAGCTEAHACADGALCCDGACIDGSTDLENCGACDNVCPSGPRGTPTCDGTCGLSCELGFGDCNDDALDGCEAELATDEAHCGACGAACSTNNAVPTCEGSTCELTCADGFDDCDGDVSNGCEAALDSATSCGACDRSCGGGTCTDGRCGAFVLATLPIAGLIGIAIDGGDLYVLGNADPRIYRVSIASGAATVFRSNAEGMTGGGASMRDAQVFGGRLYWTDYPGTGTVRSAALDGTGAIQNIPVPSVGGTFGAGGLLVEAGIVYVTSYDEGVEFVRSVDLATGDTTLLSGGGCVYYAGGIARDPVVPGGFFYGCAPGFHPSGEYLWRAGEMSGIAFPLGPGRGVRDVIVRGNEIYVATGPQIVRIDAMTGASEVLFDNTGTAFGSPHGLAIDATTLYYVDNGSNVYALRL